MTDDVRFHVTQGAEMAPDLYAGDTCDQEKPRWRIWSEGDMGDHDYIDTAKLAAKHFPPGTKITIEVPCCPRCDEPLDCGPNPETKAIEYPATCDCGFDWKAWVADRYS